MSSNNVYIPPHRRKQQSNPEKRGIASSKIQTERLVAPTAASSRRESVNDDASIELAERFASICCINLARRKDRWKTFQSRMRSTLGDEGRLFCDKVERFDAVDGPEIMSSTSNNNQEEEELIPIRLDWDATKNSLWDKHIQPPMNKQMTPGEVGCAMSHVELWKRVANSNQGTMLILEDDAVFYKGKTPPRRRENQRGRNRGNFHSNRSTRVPGFADALSSLCKILPSDWDILYLGFSDRGERNYVQVAEELIVEEPIIKVELYQPTYGFHTHAYAITPKAASVLLSNLPVNGPLDVWLADNQWFGLNVYCGVVANEGWKGQGANLISQQRHDTSSDIHQSGRGGGK